MSGELRNVDEEGKQPKAWSLRIRHALLSLAFVTAYVSLSQPGVIFVSHLGWSAWYPATGLVLTLLLGISPWYAFLALVADSCTGFILYHQSVWSYSGITGPMGVAVFYGYAAYLLRGPLRIDYSLARGRDVVLLIVAGARELRSRA